MLLTPPATPVQTPPQHAHTPLPELLLFALQGQTSVGGPASMTGYPSEVGSGYPTSNGGAHHMEGGFTPHSTSGLSTGSGLSTVPHVVNTADLKVIAQQSVSWTLEGLCMRSGNYIGFTRCSAAAGCHCLGRALVHSCQPELSHCLRVSMDPDLLTCLTYSSW